MKIYLVGGAVRDKAMRRVPRDYDYVVVGSNPDEMKSLGFNQVGADFPVFLEPCTGEEYALARTERKEYAGYCGFTSAWEGVSLEDDLRRRDLTINAMAIGDDSEFIDPFNGYDDIKLKVLRHTSEAFGEDPVRVLRVARFLARFGPEWKVAEKTFMFCLDLVHTEFYELTKERVWKETQKALSEPYPELYFKFLQSLDPEMYWFKELFDLWDIPQPITHHPENWTFKHTMMCLQQGVRQHASPQELFAILCHDLGKAPCWNERGNLHGHEDTGLPYVAASCDRLGVPSSYRDLALKVCKWHQYGHKILDVKPKKVYKFLKGLDAFRRPDTLDSFIVCNIADARGRTGFEDRDYPQAQYMRECLKAANEVDQGAVALQCIEREQPERIAEEVRCALIHSIRGVSNKWKRTKKS